MTLVKKLEEVIIIYPVTEKNLFNFPKFTSMWSETDLQNDD